jgi:multidrug efflux pump
MAGAIHSNKPFLTSGANVRRLILVALVVLLFLQDWKSLILPLIDVGVSLVGLAAKNAILVVKFSRDKRKEGMGLTKATLEASRTRLRPIIMPSFAFILGVFPLVIASGAGAEMRRTLGTAVFSGMIGVTGFGILLTPVFYYTIMRLADPGLPAPRRRRRRKTCR